jgi:PAT family beta-lactamase induction signal transducer AmpG
MVEMENNIPEVTTTQVRSHPLVYLFLILPFGVLGGYITVAFAYLFSKAGVSLEVISALVAASLLPHVVKFLWAPLVDTTFSLKKWYLVSAIITAAGIFATGMLPIKESSIPLLTIIVILANIAVSFLGIATSGLAAHNTPPEMKGRVGGYSQAGNLGGSGIGGGAGLWLAQHLTNTWMAAGILAFACLLCSVGLFFVKEPTSTVRDKKIIGTLKNLFMDIWCTMKARIGFLAIFLCFLPLSTGAASNLWSAVSADWGASADTVAIVTGLMGGIITAVGCLMGGWLCDRMDRQKAYLIFGLLQAFCAIGMAYAPHTQMMYIIWTLLYAFTLGFAYAAFSAFVFEAIGKGAAGTKFTVYACLSNFPIYYMTIVDGWAHTHYGPIGMLDIEAGLGVLSIILFLLLMKFLKGKSIY